MVFVTVNFDDELFVSIWTLVMPKVALVTVGVILGVDPVLATITLPLAIGCCHDVLLMS